MLGFPGPEMLCFPTAAVGRTYPIEGILRLFCKQMDVVYASNVLDGALGAVREPRDGLIDGNSKG